MATITCRSHRQRNSRRTSKQPRRQSSQSDIRSFLRRGTAELWSAAQLSDDERVPKFFKANGYLQGLHRSDAVHISRARARRS
ncbi:hypothetical protein PoB_005561300 [Plakobranchus ocellatus]|uniref:Uncharacterized protein n=1 Tax=Plakobranchus ocellatus TaxID=259542 RepID=A0AAV4CB73_9GAST|nr:hypothetical protein PoB_005561300 [Plakobranchus ocellatus]